MARYLVYKYLPMNLPANTPSCADVEVSITQEGVMRKITKLVVLNSEMPITSVCYRGRYSFIRLLTLLDQTNLVCGGIHYP